MIGIDTNILVRFLVDDQPEQNRSARQFFSERTAEDPAYVSAVVIAETMWVLNKRLKYSMPRDRGGVKKSSCQRRGGDRIRQ